jgi:8-oxo-dGTP pyrophosphatase MutT (NUDIX family)
LDVPTWLNWSNLEPYAWVAEKTVRWAPAISRWASKPRPAPNWKPRLTAHCIRHLHVELCSVTQSEPGLDFNEAPRLDRQKRGLVAALRRNGNLSINDPVAILLRQPNWQDSKVRLPVAAVDYATVQALDSLGQRPTMVSANALLVCPDRREVLLHRRSDASRDHKGALHTIGGAYKSEMSRESIHDRGSLANTAVREVLEETGMQIAMPSKMTMVICHESRIGFLSVGFLGVEVSGDSVLRAQGNFEGEVVPVAFDELARRLTADEWVPAGKAHVLSWLALDAPLPSGKALFRGQGWPRSGSTVFSELVE